MSRRSQVLIGAVVVAILVLLGVFAWRATRHTPAPRPVAEPQGTVLLVPGYGGGSRQLDVLAATLQRAGLRTQDVDIDDGTGDIRTYAKRVEAAAAKLVAGGQPAPDVVGYSEGGLIARAAATSDPADFRKVVTLGAPHHGTGTADLGSIFGQCPTACQQMRTDSPLIRDLPDPADPSRWLSIWSNSDQVIRPPDSSRLDGTTSYELQTACPGDVDHGALPLQAQVQAAVVAFLEGQPLPESCVSAP